MQLHSYFFFALLICVTVATNAQTAHDTSLVRQYFTTGDSLIKLSQHQKAMDNFKKAADLTQKTSLKRLHAEALFKTADVLAQLGKNDSASQVVFTVMELFSEIGDPDLEADAQELLGAILIELTHLDSAESLLESVIEIRKVNGNDLKLAKSHQSLGKVYELKGRYEESLATLEQGMAILESLREEHSSLAAQIHLTYIRNMLTMGRYDGVIERLNLVEDIYNNHSSDQPDFFKLYNFYGAAHTELGNYEKAIEYQKRSLLLNIETFGENHQNTAIAHSAMSNTYGRIDKYQQALDHAEKAIAIGKEFYHETHYIMGIFTALRAHGLKGLGEYEKSLELFIKARDIIIEDLGPNHAYAALFTQNVGTVYYDQMKDYDKAIMEYEKAFHIWNKVGKKHPNLALTYNTMGSLYNRKEDYATALGLFQKGMVANVLDFHDSLGLSNPEFTEVLDDWYLLISMYNKAVCLTQLGKEDPKQLVLAMETFARCKDMIRQIQISHIRYQDKIINAHRAHDAYSSGIRLGWLLDDVSSSLNGFELAFDFAENNRGFTIYENLSENLAQEFSGLSKKETEVEQQLKRDQSFYKSQLTNIASSRAIVDSSKYRYYQNKLIDTNESIDSLIQVFEYKYARYHQLKYNYETIHSDDVQEKLRENEAFLEYVAMDTSIYLLAVTKNQKHILRLERDSILINYATDYHKSFDPTLFLQEPEAGLKKYTQSARYLYEKLLAPALNQFTESIDHLILVPDGNMASLPWELLLTEAPEVSMDYGALAYLMKDYTISYAYSATLLYQDLYQTNRNQSVTMLAFAPSYPEAFDSISYSSIKSNFRNVLAPLKWNKKEVETISKNINGNYYSAEAATESQFKKEAGNHRILHLSMHALIDHEDPMLSKLVFSPTKDSLEDGMLHTYELYNMDLSAEMVVLSACETGIGELSRGEGVISLGRAFSYAGCPSVVMSHWSVDDESTAQLMASFYENIAGGQSKATALRNAKLDFVESAVGLKKHPFYWGGFVVMGNTDPIKQNSNWIYWMILIVAASGVILMVRKK